MSLLAGGEHASCGAGVPVSLLLAGGEHASCRAGVPVSLLLAGGEHASSRAGVPVSLLLGKVNTPAVGLVYQCPCYWGR